MRLLVSGLAALLLSLTLLPPADAARPIEGYASYDEPVTCHPKPFRGTAYLGRWVTHHYGGGYVGTARACGKHRRVTSEHQTGRAFDWSANVRKPADRRRVTRLLRSLFAADAHGNLDARARRMGIMYVIWNDRMYPAWNGFRPEPYLSSSCRTRKKCSKTLRHRDHVHVSLSKRGALGRTSFYATRL
ncbi:hypothetical protein [Nocardioides sp. URHA0020]|uniref:hypothetical protein n=1 Tax=Nocardioides sp. URHA0020 TaxID=1380392 RepID=UPI00048CD155|nr:hypothetical protein [Nocardioides sp. URHA0020]